MNVAGIAHAIIAGWHPPRRARHGPMVLVSLGILVGVAAGTAPGESTRRTVDAASSELAFEHARCPMEVPSGVYEGDDLTCGYVTVPLRHEQPGGPKIRLAVAIFSATGSHPSPDPLVLERGGPGESTLSAFAPVVASSVGSRFRRDRDIVLIEQRGTLYSQPSLACPEWNEFMDARLETDQRIEDDLDGELNAIRACRTRLVDDGVDLGAFTLAEDAADIPTVMAALGYRTYNLFATSAATLMAQHLMAAHPDALRSVVLDSPLPLAEQPYAQFVLGADHALGGRLEACAASTRCHEAFGNLKDKFLEAIDELNSRPVKVEVRNPDTEHQVDIVLNGDRLAELVYDMLSDSESVPVLPIFLQSISEHDYSLVPTFAPALFHPEDFSRGMQYSTLCDEELTFPPEQIIRRGALPQFDAIVAAIWPERLLAGCDVWAPGQPPRSDQQPVTSNVPTLVVQGQFDILPAEYGPAILAHLPNGRALTVPGAAHTPTGANNCSLDIVASFVAKPSGTLDSGCLTDIDVRFMTEPLARRILVSEPPLVRLSTLAATILLLLSVPITWLTARLRRRRVAPDKPAARRARRLLQAGAGLCLLFLIAFILANPLDALYGYPPLLRYAMLLPLLAIPLAIATLAYAGVAWREHWWQPIFRVHYTLASLALAVFIWQLQYWHLLGLRLSG